MNVRGRVRISETHNAFTQLGNMLPVWLFLCSAVLVRCADIQFLKSALQNHFSDTRHHVTNPAYKSSAREYIYSVLRDAGIEVQYHRFHVPEISREESFVNVVGILRGKNSGDVADKILGLIAHYDTADQTKGVDDNGSGVVSMLEVARQLKRFHGNFLHTIIFVATDLEEYDHTGAAKFIMDWLTPWFRQNYGAYSGLNNMWGFITMDTVMNYNASTHSQYLPEGMEYVFPDNYEKIASDEFRGDFMPVVFRNRTADVVLASEIEKAWKRADKPWFKFESFGLPFADEKHLALFGDFVRSDHIKFWAKGFPAVYLTDSGDYRGKMAYCYNQPCDDLDTMMSEENLQFLAKTTDVVTKVIAHLAKKL